MRLLRAALPIAFGLALTTLPRAARADAETSIAVLGGWGYGGDVDRNPLGGALGMRAGYTFGGAPIYLGATFLYHLGFSSADGTSSGHSALLGVEAGIDAPVGRFFTVRPYVGAGDLALTTTTTTITNDPTNGKTIVDSTTHDARFAFWPGVAGLVHVSFFAFGADARYVLAGDIHGPEFLGTFGVQFR